jgi:hypothetical protein
LSCSSLYLHVDINLTIVVYCDCCCIGLK